MKKLFPILGLLIAGLVYIGCSDDYPTQASSDQESAAVYIQGGDIVFEQEVAASKKGGGGDDVQRMTATIVPGGQTNELTDPDGAFVVGTMWATGFPTVLTDNGLEWTGDRATAPGCDGDFRNLAPSVKGGKVVSVVLLGNGGDGTNWSSDQIPIDPQSPIDTGWTMWVQKPIIVYKGKRKDKTPVCTVWLEGIEFELYVP